jgi:pilus assembly protein CpaF
MSLSRRLDQARTMSAAPVAPGTPVVDEHQRLVDLKERLHDNLVATLGPKLYSGEITPEALDQSVRVHLQALLRDEDVPLTTQDRNRLVQQIGDEVLGHGPLEPFLRDSDITEIIVNGPNHVYVERSGRLLRTSARFHDDTHVRRTIDKIVGRVGRRIDESSPMVDARLPDGSRVNAVIPPIALDGSSLTIRKFAVDPLTADDLLAFGTLTPDARWFLEAAVVEKANLLISGGTGSGKTTTLNVLSSFIPEGERIVTIEDAAELQLRQTHIVRLESRPPNIEGRGAVTIRDLVRNSLRMRPDRIIVGEVRDGAALDMLQAMNTGHEGSITTVHANSARDALARLETMVLMAGLELPSRAIREQVSSAVHIVVHQERQVDGQRRITRIAEVCGMEGDGITMRDLFTMTTASDGSHALARTDVDSPLARSIDAAATTLRQKAQAHVIDITDATRHLQREDA